MFKGYLSSKSIVKEAKPVLPKVKIPVAVSQARLDGKLLVSVAAIVIVSVAALVVMVTFDPAAKFNISLLILAVTVV